MKGGRIMVDQLGLYEDALHWWQRCREAAPLESVHIIEQTTILSDLGFYREARDRLGALFEENLDIANSQLQRITQLHKTLELSAEKEQDALFKPWQRNHPGWVSIKLRANKAPVSENFFVYDYHNSSTYDGGFYLQSLVWRGLGSILFNQYPHSDNSNCGMAFTRRVYQRVNRPDSIY